MTRPSQDDVAMATAEVWSRRSTCLRRMVGCVLTDARGRVLSTGYNGVAAGQRHCNQRLDETEIGEWIRKIGEPASWDTSEYPHACPGASAPSGTDLDGCYALHAEQNALLQCRDVDAIATCYCTTAPCMTCTKLLLNTGCKRIVFMRDYPHAEAAKHLWLGSGRDRVWEKLPEKDGPRSKPWYQV